MPTANIWYEVAVTDAAGRELDNSMCPSIEGARRAVARFRALYPSVRWITVNRKKAGRVTALVSMAVHNGTTAQERRNIAVAAEGRQ
jgi:hypothetical protein